MTSIDLNSLAIPHWRENETINESRANLGPVNASVEVLFKGLRDRLIQEIRSCEAIVGCLAWLTDPKILNALASKKFVSIIVQKEDFLRPDLGQNEAKVVSYFRRHYDRLPKGDLFFVLKGGEPSGGLYPFDGSLDPVRCIGLKPLLRPQEQQNYPRMHHKFIVFCDMDRSLPKEILWADWMLVPKSVWTGSYNPTATGSRSLENAVIINDSEVALAYAREHATLLSVSEPLDWTQRDVNPETPVCLHP